MAAPARNVVTTAVQLFLVTGGMAATALAPPAHGTLLAVPLTGGTAADTINLALARGAAIEGEGPFAGWIVLRGDRDRLAAPLRAHGILLLAGSPATCGS